MQKTKKDDIELASKYVDVPISSHTKYIWEIAPRIQSSILISFDDTRPENSLPSKLQVVCTP